LAHIFPERLGTGPESERIVHRALSHLPDDYLVVHGARWLGRPGAGRRVRDGEADFVIAHADLGVLVLEVKGGAMDFNASTGRWTSTSRSGRVNSIKDPFEQATTSKHLLLEKLRYHQRWPHRRVRFCHAVCFPDVSAKSNLLLNAPSEVVLDVDDLRTIEQSVERAFRFFDDGGAPGAAGLSVVREMLAPTLRLRRTMGSVIEREADQILELTEEQVRVIDLLRHQRRAAIAGCAGSGKTVLAVEKARQLSEEGLHVLLLCYNRRLAERLEKEVEAFDNVTAVNFHRLAMGLIRQAELELEWDTADPDFWEKTVPEVMVEAITQSSDRFDAIVVDEGQDFAASWWDPIQWLLANEDDGILYVFMDNNQRLYDRPSGIPIESAPYPLTRNCRNTQPISRFVNSYYQGDELPESQGPTGREVEIFRCDTPEKMRTSIEKRLARLVSQEGIAPRDIAVLTGHSARRSILRGLDGDGFRLNTQRVGDDLVELETIFSFKGLEKQVVALAELDDLEPDRIDGLMYVGGSRAMNHLLVFAPVDLELPSA
jgi:hypothetical protein